MPKWVGRAFLVWLIWATAAVYAADPGDNVQFKGIPGAPEINEALIKESGNRVLTEASAVSERAPALVATTGDIALTGEQTIDGVPTSGSRVMVWKQLNKAENGLYVSSGTSWARAIDANDGFEFVSHFAVLVSAGDTYAMTIFRLETTGTVTLGTTAIEFLPMPKPIIIAFTALPETAEIGTLYTVTESDSTCQSPGAVTQPCWFDGGVWQPLASGGVGGSFNLDTAHATGPVGGFTNLPISRPLKLAPNGLGGVEVDFYGQSGDFVERCRNGSTLEPCAPRSQIIYPDRELCAVEVIMDDPPTRLCLESVQNVGVGGIGTTIVRSDRGTFANRPTADYTNQTYKVNDCLTEACTAGGGTLKVEQMWTGSAWVNMGAAGGGGGTPGGSNTQVQYNDGGAFGGDAGLTFNETTNVLTATGGFAGNASTATALAANGANCSAGQAPLGVDASGAVEGCFTPAGGGTITQVWGCTTGDCSTLTGAAGDTLNATSADSVIPQPVTATLPGTCTEGQQYHDTNAGGTETYKCTATNTWTKLQAVLPWEIPFSAAGLVVDGVNCVQQTVTPINSGPNTLPVVCSDAAGTLELGFLSSTRWDGTPLTVVFVVADTTTSSHVWSANVEANCRTPGTDTISGTFGTAVAATVTMVTANVPYLASATVTPHTACAGGDWVAIRAVINNATTHTDANARILGGRIQGNQL